MIQIWIATGITILTCVVTIVVNFTVVRVRVDNLTSRESELKQGLDSATKELNTAVGIIKTMAAEQSIINKFVADMLTTLNIKLEIHTNTLSEHSAAIAILRDRAK